MAAIPTIHGEISVGGSITSAASTTQTSPIRSTEKAIGIDSPGFRGCRIMYLDFEASCSKVSPTAAAKFITATISPRRGAIPDRKSEQNGSRVTSRGGETSITAAASIPKHRSPSMKRKTRAEIRPDDSNGPPDGSLACMLDCAGCIDVFCSGVIIPGYR